jgi:hypothetical protein
MAKKRDTERIKIENKNVITINNSPNKNQTKPKTWRNVITVIIGVLGLIGTYLVVPEVRKILNLDKTPISPTLQIPNITQTLNITIEPSINQVTQNIVTEETILTKVFNSQIGLEIIDLYYQCINENQSEDKLLECW